jgi:hypothetical protein
MEIRVKIEGDAIGIRAPLHQNPGPGKLLVLNNSLCVVISHCVIRLSDVWGVVHVMCAP